MIFNQDEQLESTRSPIKKDLIESPVQGNFTQRELGNSNKKMLNNGYFGLCKIESSVRPFDE